MYVFVFIPHRGEALLPGGVLRPGLKNTDEVLLLMRRVIQVRLTRMPHLNNSGLTRMSQVNPSLHHLSIHSTSQFTAVHSQQSVHSTRHGL